MEYVSQSLNEEFWNLVTVESNRKAAQFFATHQNFKRRSIFPSWFDTNAEEMKFIGLILLQGLVKKLSWRQYWSKDPLTFTPTLLPSWTGIDTNCS